jgi:hypothetical protein
MVSIRLRQSRNNFHNALLWLNVSNKAKPLEKGSLKALKDNSTVQLLCLESIVL